MLKQNADEIVVLLKIIFNKGTSDCFINLSPVNNDTVHMSHHFVAMETILAEIYVLP